jgi:hypothetical protein
MSEEETISWEAIAKQLQRDLEQAQIKLATQMKPADYIPDFFYSLQRRWNGLSYVEKLYTVSVIVMLAFFVGEKVISITRRMYL